MTLTSGEFVEALEAVHLLSPMLGGDRAAKRAIVERLQDGAIRSSCWWLAEGIDYGHPYLSPAITVEWDEGDAPPAFDAQAYKKLRMEVTRPKVSSSEYGDGLATHVSPLGEAHLALGFWTRVKKSDLRRWQWSEGFVLASEDRGHTFPIRSFALGVKFAKEDIMAILGSKLLAVPKDRQETRGRKRSDHWPTWIAEVIALHDDGDLMGLSATKLITEIEGRLLRKGKDYPSMETVRTTAAAIVDRINANRN